MEKYDPDTIMPKLKPMCLSTNAQKHKLIPAENEGWYVVHVRNNWYIKLTRRENWNWKQKVSFSLSRFLFFSILGTRSYEVNGIGLIPRTTFELLNPIPESDSNSQPP